MKRCFTTLTLLLAIVAMIAGQTKFSPRALISIERQKTKIEKQALAPGVEAPAASVVLVVSIDGNNAAETIRQIKAAGATIRTKLGHQVTVSIPVEQVGALEKIDGVLRIDKGHKGYLKTDIARAEVGVNLLNGPEVPEGATIYSGQGVNVIVMDVGIDFQHPAFKDADGNSRIKCVYVNNSDAGHKFTVVDPEAGEYTFPGSVFDTPELIATLTTDQQSQTHGTHTTSIAAGSLTDLGFGGMAPGADIVLIPFGFKSESYESEDDFIEEVLAFAAAYARQSDQPTVLSASLNNHAGPHDGTSTASKAIAEVSQSLIPVFSAGNEGYYPIHLYKKFTADDESIKTTLLSMLTDETGVHQNNVQATVSGFTRAGQKVGVCLSLMGLSAEGISTLWCSDTMTATFSSEPQYRVIDSSQDEELNKVFHGQVAIAAADNEDNRLSVAVQARGGIVKDENQHKRFFQLDIIGDNGTEIDLWDNVVGFGGTKYTGLTGYVDGDSEISGGDWTSTDRVISVGAYTTNLNMRAYDGTVTDNSQSLGGYTLNDIAPFSSYGTMLNGVSQPMVCAPGVNIVSAWNHYAITGSVAESMKWNDGPYNAQSGTSMSCPAVSGIVALWLEAKPDMTFDDVVKVIEETSVKDEFTTSTARWGAGKINALRGIEYITQSVGITSVNDDAPYNGDDAYYDMMGRRYTTRPASGFYIHKGKKVIIR